MEKKKNDNAFNFYLFAFLVNKLQITLIFNCLAFDVCSCMLFKNRLLKKVISVIWETALLNKQRRSLKKTRQKAENAHEKSLAPDGKNYLQSNKPFKFNNC